MYKAPEFKILPVIASRLSRTVRDLEFAESGRQGILAQGRLLYDQPFEVTSA